jgi:EmrB/QacA subfamily drug resistance transporter
MNKTALLWIVCITGFLAPFMSSAVNIALPAIGSNFSLDVVDLGWVVTSYILATAVFLLPFGRLADIHGRKRVFVFGSVLFVAASILCGVSTSGTMLVIARSLQGLANAMVFGTSVAILTAVFPPQERGKAIGINTAAVYLGMSLGPVLGGIVTQHWGWQGVFWLSALLGSVAVVMSFMFMKREWADAKGESFDLLGSVVYALASLLTLYGFTLLPDLSGYICAGGGILFFAVFGVVEDKLEHPVFNIDLLLKNRVFALSCLAALINYSTTFCIGFLLSLYLQYAKGMEPTHAGLILLSQPLMMTLTSPFAGRLSDRIEPGRVASMGMTLVAIALYVLAMLTTESDIWMIVTVLLVLGTGFGLFSSPNTNAIMSSVENKHLGVASSIFATMRVFGQMMSMGVTMLVLSVIVGKVEMSPDTVPQFMTGSRLLFLMFAILSTLGIFASLARGKIRDVKR